MNIELIKKYKKEFDYRLNGGNLKIKHPTKGRIGYYDKDVWTHSTDTPIVIDDKYLDLRVALSEGKTLQYNANYNKSYDYWADVQKSQLETLFDTWTPETLRIKPEPSFKPGIWVTQHGVGPFQYTKDTCHLGLALWEPKEGEWCWFWTPAEVEKEKRLPELGRLLHMSSGSSYYASTSSCPHGRSHTRCEPFIGELPSFVKDR